MAALVVVTLAVAAVLLTSGVAKVRDPDAASRGFDELHVPDAFARPWMRRALPWVEIGLGGALLVLPLPASTLAALAALALFVVYLVLVSRAVASGEEADCNCFGSLTSGRVTRWTLARNVTLVALAIGAIADSASGDSAIARVFRPDALSWLVVLAAVGFLGYTILRGDAQAITGIARALRVPSEPAASATGGGAELPDLNDDDADADYVRTPNPTAVLLNPDGTPVTLAALTRSRAVLLIWLSIGCGPCSQVLPQVEGWRRRLPVVDVRPVLSTLSAVPSAPEELRDIVLVDHDSTLSRAVAPGGVPSAVLFGADGMLAGGPVFGSDAVAQLVEDIADQLAESLPDGAGDVVIAGEVVQDAEDVSAETMVGTVENAEGEPLVADAEAPMDGAATADSVVPDEAATASDEPVSPDTH